MPRPPSNPTMPLPSALEHDVKAACACAAPVAVGAYGDLPAAQRFAAALRDLSEHWGAPDWPGGSFDWPRELGLTRAANLAVWDFDYHQISLRLDGARLVLERHGR